MKETIIHTTIATTTTEIDKCKTYIYDKRFTACCSRDEWSYKSEKTWKF